MSDEFYGLLIGVVMTPDNRVAIGITMPGAPMVIMSPKRAALLAQTLHDSLDYCGYFDDGPPEPNDNKSGGLH